MRLWIGRLLVVTACLCIALPTAAHASDELGLSRDGRTWSGQLDGSLFDPQVRWVPGDVRTSEFFVRNQGEDRGTLTIAVDSQDPDRLLRNGEIALVARLGSGQWATLEHTGQTYRLVDEALSAGASQKVQVRASFDPASSNRSQRDRLGLDFRVTLTDATADPGDDPGEDPGGPGDDDGGLPNTGAPMVGWLIVIAGIALGGGLGLMRRGRREEAGHGTTP